MKFNYLKKKLINVAIFILSLVICLVLIEGTLIFTSTDVNDNYQSQRNFKINTSDIINTVTEITNIFLQNPRVHFEFSF
jgi:hypothetical protein